jgi:hypothetical protein
MERLKVIGKGIERAVLDGSSFCLITYNLIDCFQFSVIN